MGFRFWRKPITTINIWTSNPSNNQWW